MEGIYYHQTPANLFIIRFYTDGSLVSADMDHQETYVRHWIEHRFSRNNSNMETEIYYQENDKGLDILHENQVITRMVRTPDGGLLTRGIPGLNYRAKFMLWPDNQEELQAEDAIKHAMEGIGGIKPLTGPWAVIFFPVTLFRRMLGYMFGSWQGFLILVLLASALFFFYWSDALK
ncbi:hypothetical protein [Chitinophaga sp. Cy-1792]|uniref:hypothetical protein n=1 Tax=Chitinophaga sp. Cy-1792 TaxID=2608339 RepID=UPI001422FEDF|nr:hypothetical protein [Chitinophaga sp. Cy-1792]NIG54172.1 hypothetical protein [Chitinophaga sp. Cy-1792]